MKKKIIASLLSIAMASAMLVGCGSSTTSTTSTTSAATDTSAADVGSTTTVASDSKSASGTGELTIYYSNSTDWADPIIQEFGDETGIKCNLVQDGTSSLFARVKAESANPQADVIWGGVIDTYRANQDLLQQYTPGDVGSLKAEAVDENGYYTGFDMGPMVMIYNTDLVSADEAPTGWADLLDEKYKGQIACADPTSSSSSFACMMAIMQAFGTDDGKGYDFVEKLAKNLDGKVLDSSSGVYKGVADGEYMVGLTYEEAALRYIDSGAAIQVVYPKEGTSASPSGIGIIKDCPDTENAKKFVDYLISKDVQTQLGGIFRRSVRSDVTDPDTFEPWDQIKFVNGDINWTSSHTEEFNDKWTSFITE